MIGIINYGLGNIRAFANIYESLNIKFKIISSLNDFSNIDKIILPGVGSFDNAINKFENSGLKNKFEELVLVKKMPVLGICVGMQILANFSEEGILPGLGLVNGKVLKLPDDDIPFKTKTPHMGWNNISILKFDNIFKNFNENEKFYFLHSYYFKCDKVINTIAKTTYGGEFTSSIQNENIFGVQFHPEKSHENGIKLLKNFNNL